MRNAAEHAKFAGETRREYTSRGLCPYCYGERRARPGKEACRACADERNRRYNERREAWIAAGMCGKCGKAPRDGALVFCRACNERKKALELRRYVRIRAANICDYCGAPSVPGRCYCPTCARREADKNTERYREKQRRRPTCAHQVWRLKMRIFAETAEEHEGRVRVRVQFRQTCPECRKCEQRTRWVDMERLAEVIAWQGGTPVLHERGKA